MFIRFQLIIKNMTNLLKNQLTAAGFFETQNNHFTKIKLKNYYNIIEVVFSKPCKFEIKMIDTEFDINEQYVFKTENEVLKTLKNKKII